MSYIKVWLHIVWATKQRQPLLSKSIRQNVFSHIKENAATKGIYIDCIDGHADHLHILLSLGADQTIAKAIQLLKGESSFWINQSKLINSKFEWQDDYFAVSISESNIGNIRAYIMNQEIHHTKKTFQQEYDEFMMKYGFKV